jgi:L-fuculose-phosphate aldolase
VKLASESERVAAAARQLAAEGLVIGTGGNVSARAGELVAITPTGAKLADLQSSDVTVIDLNGTVVDGQLEPTSELELHLGVYRRFDAGAVVHTHAPMSTALSCVIDELPCVHYQMLLLGGTVPVAPYETFGTPELANSVLAALEGHTAALMANHGAITYAADVDTAISNALLLEWACSVYWYASTLGEPRTIDEGKRAAVVKAARERGYGSTRKVERAERDEAGKEMGRS